MPPLGQTALVVLVPEADPALALVAAQYPHLVRPGLPAHVTVLYPWIPASEIDSAALNRCASLAASVDPTKVSFSAVQVHPGILFLEPDQRHIVNRLSQRAQSCWPSLRPYGGKYPDSPPHVTLALGAMRNDEIEAIRTLVTSLLPMQSRFDALHVVAFDESGWNGRHRFPFGTSGVR
jgi:2'-5' RNA ligase superfamily protein